MLGHGYRVAVWHHSGRQPWSSDESRRLLSPLIGKSPILQRPQEHPNFSVPHLAVSMAWSEDVFEVNVVAVWWTEMVEGK